MGGFGSGRWVNHQRQRCVEECEKQKATHCPICGHGVRFVYSPPSALADSGFALRDWGCRSCHGLTYLSRQKWGTLAGDLANDSELLMQYANAAQETINLYQSMPFDLRTAEQMLDWMKERDKQLKAAYAVVSMCNRLPESRVRALFNGEVKARPSRRRKKPKSEI